MFSKSNMPDVLFFWTAPLINRFKTQEIFNFRPEQQLSR
jgi:hypothetical protein